MRTLLRILASILPLSGVILVAQTPRPVKSELCIHDLRGGTSRLVLTTSEHIEAPNWTPDGKYLLVNSGGRLFEIELAEPRLKPVPTGSVTRVNNDHGVSPDGKILVVSASHMYTLPRSGGEPKQITSKTPSYYHGWSPDGRMLAFCAQREGNFDIYVIPVEGGAEIRMTADPAHDDGPDYSHDGRWIYFNSSRGGEMDIWRIPAGKTAPQDEEAELVVGGPRADWFPHPSPDGKGMVYLSYPERTDGHPANRPVELRWIPLDAGDPASQQPRILETFIGGQGSINVNSWAPDGRAFAYVRYQYAEP